MIHDVVKKNLCILLHSLLEKHSKHLWVLYCCSFFQFLLCMPGARPDPKWRCRGHISHFASAPGHISHSGLLPIRAHWGCCQKSITLPPSPSPPACHPPTRLGGRVSRAPSVHPVYATDLPLSQKQGKVHVSAELQAGRQSIEGGGKPRAGHPSGQSYLMASRRSLPDLLSYNPKVH